MQPVVERVLYGSSPLRTAAGTVDVDELLAMVEDQFAEGPRTRAQLVAAIAERWPERDASSLGYAMYLIPTVQVTPRGIWGRSGASAFTTVERWLGRPIERSTEPDEMIAAVPDRVRPVRGGGRAVVVGVDRAEGRVRTPPPAAAHVPGRARTRAVRRPGRPAPRSRDTGTGPLPARVRQRAARPRRPQQDRAARPEGMDRGRVGVGPGRRVRRGAVEGGARPGPGDPVGRAVREDRTRRSRTRSAEEGERLLAFLAPETDRRDVRFRTFRGSASSR